MTEVKVTRHTRKIYTCPFHCSINAAFPSLDILAFHLVHTHEASLNPNVKPRRIIDLGEVDDYTAIRRCPLCYLQGIEWRGTESELRQHLIEAHNAVS